MSFSKDNLTSKEICRIIEAGSKGGVTEIKFGDFFISFKKTNEIETPTPSQGSLDQANTKPIDEPSFIRQMEQDNKDDELANLLIENPAAYEDALLVDDLKDRDEYAGSEPEES